MDPPARPKVVQDMIIRDGDGFDADGIDVDGDNRIGFNAAGLNRARQSITKFPPAFIRRLEETANMVQAAAQPWIAPPTIDIDDVRKAYPRWYEMQESVFPEIDQVSQPL
jgi:hypothetical protein